MHTFTEENLRKIMIECVSADESVDLSGEITEVPFADLGYDSLLVLELIGRLKRAYRIDVSDDLVTTLITPGDFVAVANESCTGVSAR
jgi:act minimal PKS acyl carrier protein